MASTYSEWGPLIGMIFGAVLGLVVYIVSNRSAEKKRRRDG